MPRQWMNTVMGDTDSVVVDLGYLSEEGTAQRADALMKVISKRNFEYLHYGNCRLFVTIPPTKVKPILKSFPGIKEGKTYFGCTHNWLELDRMVSSDG